MKRIIDFMGQSMSGPDNKASSKKITAFWLVLLVTAVVFTLLVICFLAVFRQIEVKGETRLMVEMIGGQVLLYLLTTVLLLFGVQGWAQIASLKAVGTTQKPEPENPGQP